MHLAVDVGYGATKAVTSDGRRACVPSVAAPASHDLTGGLFGQTTPHRVRMAWVGRSPEEFLVGQAARTSLSAISFGGSKKPADVHDLLALTAAYLVGAGTDGPPERTPLAVGLPLAYYRAQRDALKIRLEGLAARVSVDDGHERYLSFGPVAVLPQGAGVVLAEPVMPDGMVGVVDVGTYTTDFLLLEIVNGQPHPITDGCGSIEVAVHQVHQALAAAYQSTAGQPLSPERAETLLLDALAGRHTTHYGREIGLTRIAQRGVISVGSSIVQAVLSSWGRRASQVRQTVVAGGGGLMFRQPLEQGLPGVRVATEPVYANALGYLAALGARLVP